MKRHNFLYPQKAIDAECKLVQQGAFDVHAEVLRPGQPDLFQELINNEFTQARGQSLELHGFPATVLQRELDCLDGSLYVDRMTELSQLAFGSEFER